ncbi:4-hydroxy-tetrahydrodipicolinate reductase [Candidatus Bathyarchaeota archaeon]|nr:4-hydroxy-tetrahydrodipicolinate reductase [Candidatus Bathyarchaeota archaeon]
MIRVCIAGATGRMGSTVLREACLREGFEVVGAVASPNNPNIGKTLSDLGLCDLDVELVGPDRLSEAVENADVYISFTTPEAEKNNLPVVADLGRKIVMGTTGFSEEDLSTLKLRIAEKVPAVFAPNFAIGVNVLFKVLSSLKALPETYDFSIIEMHHKGKKDAPSGTAAKLGAIISGFKGYEKTVYGRSGVSLRKSDELEILSVRAGGIPGIHEVVAAGKYEVIRIEHTSFSRSVFAEGALYAAEWVHGQERPGVYSMEDVLGL